MAREADMSELEEQLSTVLNNPDEMKKVMQMASSLFGGGNKPAALPAPAEEFSEHLPEALPEISPELMGQAMKLLKGVGGKGGKFALLGAVKPYLSEERSKKLERAIVLAGIIGAGLKLLDKDGGIFKRLGINGGAL
jgi:hypothetical protein